MGQCPFCRESVEADILVNGGRCPSCLIEIPGEEAATNPGANALAVQAAEEEAARRSPLPLIAAAALVLVVVGGIGWTMSTPEAEPIAVGASGADIYKKVGAAGLRKINLDDEPLEVEEPPPVQKAETRPARPAKPTKVATTTPVDGGPAAPPPVVASVEAPTAPTKAGILSSGGSGGVPTIDDAMNLGGPGKKGPGRLEVCGAEVRKVLKTNLSALQGRAREKCVNKANRGPDFQASANVTMVVQRSGALGQVLVQVSGTTDPSFQTCVEQAARAIDFPPFCEDLEVSKNLKFGG